MRTGQRDQFYERVDDQQPGGDHGSTDRSADLMYGLSVKPECNGNGHRLNIPMEERRHRYSRRHEQHIQYRQRSHER